MLHPAIRYSVKRNSWCSPLSSATCSLIGVTLLSTGTPKMCLLAGVGLGVPILGMVLIGS